MRICLSYTSFGQTQCVSFLLKTVDALAKGMNPIGDSAVYASRMGYDSEYQWNPPKLFMFLVSIHSFFGGAPIISSHTHVENCRT